MATAHSERDGDLTLLVAAAGRQCWARHVVALDAVPLQAGALFTALLPGLVDLYGGRKAPRSTVNGLHCAGSRIIGQSYTDSLIE